MLFHLYTLFYRWKTGKKSVNIFHKDNFCLTISSSAYYKTYCFAFQKRRFCKAKEPLLDGKTYAFAVPNRNYRFSSELSLQNKNDFHSLSFLILHCKTTMVLLYNRGIKWVFTINCYYIFRAVFSAKHLLNTTERLVWNHCACRI